MGQACTKGSLPSSSASREITKNTSTFTKLLLNNNNNNSHNKNHPKTKVVIRDPFTQLLYDHDPFFEPIDVPGDSSMPSILSFMNKNVKNSTLSAVFSPDPNDPLHRFPSLSMATILAQESAIFDTTDALSAYASLLADKVEMLTFEEVHLLLQLFRRLVFAYRRLHPVTQSFPLTNVNKPDDHDVANPATLPSTLYKRLSLPVAQLSRSNADTNEPFVTSYPISLLTPSFSVDTLAQAYDTFHRHYYSRIDDTVENNGHNVTDNVSRLKASIERISDVWFTLSDCFSLHTRPYSYITGNKEMVFQDFCVFFSLLIYGDEEDFAMLLYLLFAEKLSFSPESHSQYPAKQGSVDTTKQKSNEHDKSKDENSSFFSITKRLFLKRSASVSGSHYKESSILPVTVVATTAAMNTNTEDKGSSEQKLFSAEPSIYHDANSANNNADNNDCKDEDKNSSTDPRPTSPINPVIDVDSHIKDTMHNVNGADEDNKPHISLKYASFLNTHYRLPASQVYNMCLFLAAVVTVHTQRLELHCTHYDAPPHHAEKTQHNMQVLSLFKELLQRLSHALCTWKGSSFDNNESAAVMDLPFDVFYQGMFPQSSSIPKSASSSSGELSSIWAGIWDSGTQAAGGCVSQWVVKTTVSQLLQDALPADGVAIMKDHVLQFFHHTLDTAQLTKDANSHNFDHLAASNNEHIVSTVQEVPSFASPLLFHSRGCALKMKRFRTVLMHYHQLTLSLLLAKENARVFHQHTHNQHLTSKNKQAYLKEFNRYFTNHGEVIARFPPVKDMLEWNSCSEDQAHHHQTISKTIQSNGSSIPILDGFALRADWFVSFCDACRLVPVYFCDVSDPDLSYIVMDIVPAASSVSDTASNVLDFIACFNAQTFETHRQAADSPAVSVSPLQNAVLLTETLPGVVQLLTSPTLCKSQSDYRRICVSSETDPSANVSSIQPLKHAHSSVPSEMLPNSSNNTKEKSAPTELYPPFSPVFVPSILHKKDASMIPTSNSSNVVDYVIVPYTLGALLYRYFDEASAVYAPQLFRCEVRLNDFEHLLDNKNDRKDIDNVCTSSDSDRLMNDKQDTATHTLVTQELLHKTPSLSLRSVSQETYGVYWMLSSGVAGTVPVCSIPVTQAIRDKEWSRVLTEVTSFLLPQTAPMHHHRDFRLWASVSSAPSGERTPDVPDSFLPFVYGHYWVCLWDTAQNAGTEQARDVSSFMVEQAIKDDSGIIWYSDRLLQHRLNTFLCAETNGNSTNSHDTSDIAGTTDVNNGNMVLKVGLLVDVLSPRYQTWCVGCVSHIERLFPPVVSPETTPVTMLTVVIRHPGSTLLNAVMDDDLAIDTSSMKADAEEEVVREPLTSLYLLALGTLTHHPYPNSTNNAMNNKYRFLYDEWTLLRPMTRASSSSFFIELVQTVHTLLSDAEVDFTIDHDTKSDATPTMHDTVKALVSLWQLQDDVQHPTHFPYHHPQSLSNNAFTHIQRIQEIHRRIPPTSRGILYLYHNLMTVVTQHWMRHRQTLVYLQRRFDKVQKRSTVAVVTDPAVPDNNLSLLSLFTDRYDLTRHVFKSMNGLNIDCLTVQPLYDKYLVPVKGVTLVSPYALTYNDVRQYQMYRVDANFNSTSNSIRVMPTEETQYQEKASDKDLANDLETPARTNVTVLNNNETDYNKTETVNDDTSLNNATVVHHVSGRGNNENTHAVARVVSKNDGVSRTIGIVGFMNLGNSCYFSAILQCLCRTPLVTQYFLSHQHRHLSTATQEDTTTMVYKLAQFMRIIYLTDMQQHVRTPVQNSNNKAKHPSKKHRLSETDSIYPVLSLQAVLEAFRQRKTQFQNMDQQDAQELLAELLDALHEDMKRPRVQRARTHPIHTHITPDSHSQGKEASGSVTVANNTFTSFVPSSTTTVSHSRDTVKDEDQSLISDVFQGQLLHRVLCGTCGKTSDTRETFTTLSLPLLAGHTAHATVTHDLSTRHLSDDQVSVNSTQHSHQGSSSSFHLPHPVSDTCVTATQPPMMVQVQVTCFLKLPRFLYLMSDLLCPETMPPVYRDAFWKCVQVVYRLRAEPMRVSVTVPLYDTTRHTQGRNRPTPSQSSHYTPIAVLAEEIDETVRLQWQTRLRNVDEELRCVTRLFSETLLQLESSRGEEGCSSNDRVMQMGHDDDTPSSRDTDESEEHQRVSRVACRLVLSLVSRLQEAFHRDTIGGAAAVSLFALDTRHHLVTRLDPSLHTCKHLLAASSGASGRSGLNQGKDRIDAQIIWVEDTKDTQVFVSQDRLVQFLQEHETSSTDALSMKRALQKISNEFLQNEEENEEDDEEEQLKRLTQRHAMLLSCVLLDALEYGHHNVCDTDMRQCGTFPVCNDVLFADNNSVDMSTPPALVERSPGHSSCSGVSSSAVSLYRRGQRVDAQDHKGDWYSGTVTDTLTLCRHRDTAENNDRDTHKNKDKKHQNLSRSRFAKYYNPQFESGSSQRRDTDKLTGDTPLKTHVSQYLRVHFDQFASHWDEIYELSPSSSSAASTLKLKPIFHETARSLSVATLPVFHRHVCHQDTPTTMEKTPTSVTVQLSDTPQLLIVENYRSCWHLLVHLLEQCVVRFTSAQTLETLRHLVSFVAAKENEPQLQDTQDETQHKLAWLLFLKRLPVTIRLVHKDRLTTVKFSDKDNDKVPHSTDNVPNISAKNSFFGDDIAHHVYSAQESERVVTQWRHSQLSQAQRWEGECVFPSVAFQEALGRCSETLLLQRDNSSADLAAIDEMWQLWMYEVFPLVHRPVASLLNSQAVLTVDWESAVVLETPSSAAAAAAAAAAAQGHTLLGHNDHSRDTEHNNLGMSMFDGDTEDKRLATPRPRIVPFVTCRNGRESGISGDSEYFYEWPPVSIFGNPHSHEEHNAEEVRKSETTVNEHSTKHLSSVASTETQLQSRYNDPRPGFTLEALLRRFTETEEIDYYCDTCRALTRSQLTCRVAKTPDVFVIHLKRLVVNSTGGTKMRTLVKFPLTHLDMKPFTMAAAVSQDTSPDNRHETDVFDSETIESQSFLFASQQTEGDKRNPADTETPASDNDRPRPTDFFTSKHTNKDSATDDPFKATQKKKKTEVNNEVYDLYGVVNHLGGMFGGHYTAFVKCETPSMPVHCDDNDNNNNNETVNRKEGRKAFRIHDLVGGGLSDVLQSDETDTSVFAEDKLEHLVRHLCRGLLTEDEVTNNVVHLQEYLTGTSGSIGQNKRTSGGLNSAFVYENAKNETLDSGAKAAMEEKWFCFDDEYVSELLPLRCEEEEEVYDPVVVTESAYLLFYRKQYLSKDNVIRYT